MSNVGTDQLDTIIRIYKNADGKVIGVHCLSVRTTTEHLPNSIPGEYPELAQRRKRSMDLNVGFQRFNLDIGGPRVITSVLMMGKYDDFIVSGSDISEVTYFGRDTEGLENDLVISLTEFPTVGDTV